MKIAAAVVSLALVLLVGCFGLGSAVLTSAPFATDAQRPLYDEAVKETHLAIPGAVLLAVDTVRYHQDFSQVTRETIRQTAEYFLTCADMAPIRLRKTAKAARVPFTVPRPGQVKFSLSFGPPGTTVRIVDAQGRAYTESPATVTPGEYWLEVSAPDERSHWQVGAGFWLDPCGPVEISTVLDNLGLQGDDRAMVYHLTAIYFPELQQHGRIAPGPYAWPVADSWPITSPFGQRLDPVTGEWRLHTGVDIGPPAGTPVGAATDGTVVYAGWDGNYGYVVRVDHGAGIVTAYGHLQAILVAAGQSVTKGQALGLVGSTGKSTGPHLHFEWWVGGEPVDPLAVYHWQPEETER